MTAPHVPTDERDRIDFKQHLRQGRWLDEQKPVPICRGKLLIGSFVHIKGRCDIQQEQTLYMLGMIQRQTMRHPRTPVVSRSEEHTSELQSLMRISYAVFCLQKKNHNKKHTAKH